MVPISVRKVCRAAAACALLLCLAQAKEEKSYAPPPVVHANTFPGHMGDPENKVTLAIDAYDDAAKAGIFTVDYLKYGLLPIELIVSNDGDQAITTKNLRVELVTGRKVKLAALSENEIMDRLFRRGEVRGHVSSPMPLPIPLPHKAKESDAQKAREELDRARFSFLAIEPHTTRVGFLFFDSSPVSDAVTGSYVYVNGVRNSQGQELLYFELSVERSRKSEVQSQRQDFGFAISDFSPTAAGQDVNHKSHAGEVTRTPPAMIVR
jgi:hypothetical protein